MICGFFGLVVEVVDWEMLDGGEFWNDVVCVFEKGGKVGLFGIWVWLVVIYLVILLIYLDILGILLNFWFLLLIVFCLWVLILWLCMYWRGLYGCLILVLDLLVEVLDIWIELVDVLGGLVINFLVVWGIFNGGNSFRIFLYWVMRFKYFFVFCVCVKVDWEKW